MIKLYENSGYINFNAVAQSGVPFNWLIGGRGIGKTYSGLKNLIIDKKTKFIYMRRTKAQIELSSLHATMPFKKINDDFDRKIEPKKEKEFIYFDEDKERIALGASLSTFYNLRGVSLDEYDALFFDEIIPEPMERVRKGEGRALLDAIETINRNRELQKRKPIKCYFIGNSDTLNSDILNAFGIVDILEKMIDKGEQYYINRETGNAVFYYLDAPVSKLKKDTALYKAAKNKNFKEKAIDNIFTDIKLSNDIKRIPLKECKIFCNIDDEVGVYEHKNGNYFYVCKVTNSCGRTFNLINGKERRIFLSNYGEIIRRAISEGNIYYDSFASKIMIENAVYC